MLSTRVSHTTMRSLSNPKPNLLPTQSLRFLSHQCSELLSQLINQQLNHRLLCKDHLIMQLEFQSCKLRIQWQFPLMYQDFKSKLNAGVNSWLSFRTSLWSPLFSRFFRTSFSSSTPDHSPLLLGTIEKVTIDKSRWTKALLAFWLWFKFASDISATNKENLQNWFSLQFLPSTDKPNLDKPMESKWPTEKHQRCNGLKRWSRKSHAVWSLSRLCQLWLLNLSASILPIKLFLRNMN